MDDEDFFDFSKDFERKTVSIGTVKGRVHCDESIVKKELTRKVVGTAYAQEWIIKDETELLEQTMMDCTAARTANKSKLDEVDDDNMAGEPQPGTSSRQAQNTDDIYTKYQFHHKSNIELPIHSEKFKILQSIDNYAVTILQGATGCGKTTQVPQFILDEARRKNEYCNIVVTQPRRIAAISIAKRVSVERKWPLGTLVGHQVGLNANVDADTRMLFCTTGILLQKLIKSKNLSQYTHIILDEVHERDNDMDFLLIVIRKLMAASLGSVKIILMSATIDAYEFSEYFKFPHNGAFINAPIVNVDRKSQHTVKEFYLCDLGRLKISRSDINYDEPGISEGLYKIAFQLMLACEKFDLQEAVDNDDGEKHDKASILIFLPGLYEIETMYKTIERLQADYNCKFKILPLHSSVTNEEQQLVFDRPPLGYRKIILSTNIAESSITVPDIKYVIDFCLTKSLCADTATNCTSLRMEWASRNNCRQRSGRTGRLMNGRVYRMVSRNFYENGLKESQTPEILRSPLELIVLRTKILDMGSPHSILALAMNPPKLSDIENTICALKEAGAMLKTVNGCYEAFDGDITYMGRIMSALPLDIRVSKLIVLGYVFDILNDTIQIAAGLTVRNIFSHPFNSALDAYFHKMNWSDGSGSDLIAIQNAYTIWCQKKTQNMFQSDAAETSWAKRYYLQVKALCEMSTLIREIRSRLKNLNIEVFKSPDLCAWSKKERNLVLKIVISGAFYPYYFHTSSVLERESFHVLGGRDPCNTVFFKGFDPSYVGILYEKSIKQMFTPITQHKNLKITFDNNSQRIFVTFLNSDKYRDTSELYNRPGERNMIESMPGRVLTEIYKSVKMRKLKSQMTLPVLSKNDAVAYAKSNSLGEYKAGIWYPKKKTRSMYKIVVPTVEIREIQGVVPHVDNVNKFFFQPKSTFESLALMHNSLIPAVLMPYVEPGDINIGEIVAAMHYRAGEPVGDSYFRAKVNDVTYGQSGSEVYFDLFYIDYGNINSVKFSEIRKLGSQVEHIKDVPPCMFQCTLAGIKPSFIDSPKEVWTTAAVKELIEFTQNKELTAEIYSYVNGIASVYLKGYDASINQILTQKGFAEFAEESYMSKANHELRVRRQNTNPNTKPSDKPQEIYNEDDDEEFETEVEPPPLELCRQRISLSGPHSPLETNAFPVMRYVEYQTATIDPLSINSVLLDTEPQDSNSRLLVGGSIGRNPSTNSLIARFTTLMPNIKGFETIVGLIFCPTMEANRDPTRTRYSSFLTGLGYDPKTRMPYYEEHDVLFKLNTQIVTDDLENINQIRYSMDTLLYAEQGDERPTISEDSKISVVNKIKSVLINLFTKPRSSAEVFYTLNDFKWGKVRKNEMYETQNIYGHRAIFPLHSAMYLEEPKEQDLFKLRQNCTELYKLAVLDINIQPFECKLCLTTLESVSEIRIHMYTKLHADREAQIKFIKTESKNLKFK